MREFLITIAAEAGALLSEAFAKLAPADVAQKGLRTRDLVTAADLASEAHLLARIRERFPDHSIFAEESGRRIDNPAHWWFIDPLDGTVNFAHGYPLFAVSIAYWEKGAFRHAVVHAPYLGETFAASAGDGCTLNRAPCRVTAEPALSRALLATGFAYQRNEVKNNNLAMFTRLVLGARGVRRGGAAALDLAYVACGRLDGFWEPYLAPWDVAAGALCVIEAGGCVTDFFDEPRTPNWLFGETIVASNGALHPALIEKMIALDRGYPYRYTPPPMAATNAVAPDYLSEPRP